jgi:hypothetical protein
VQLCALVVFANFDFGANVQSLQTSLLPIAYFDQDATIRVNWQVISSETSSLQESGIASVIRSEPRYQIPISLTTVQSDEDLELMQFSRRGMDPRDFLSTCSTLLYLVALFVVLSTGTLLALNIFKYKSIKVNRLFYSLKRALLW